MPEDDTSRVSTLVKKVLDGHSFEGPEVLLQKILTECAVKPSLNLGLCGDSHKLVFAGDGTPLETESVARIQNWCNNLPRKILGYLTPLQAFHAERLAAA